MSLFDCIFAEGFSTQHDPLLVWKNPQAMEQDSFWLSFVNGHSRARTALAMAKAQLAARASAEQRVAEQQQPTVRIRMRVCSAQQAELQVARSTTEELLMEVSRLEIALR